LNRFYIKKTQIKLQWTVRVEGQNKPLMNKMNKNQANGH
jgi:hypothetical protein